MNNSKLTLLVIACFLLHAVSGSENFDNALAVVKGCYSEFMNNIPPTFCYKSGGDAGTKPSECPEGFSKYNSTTRCYQTCKEGYTFYKTRCLEVCPPGYRTSGEVCMGGITGYITPKSYAPTYNTNFVCEEGKYLSGGLCYRLCGKLITSLQNAADTSICYSFNALSYVPIIKAAFGVDALVSISKALAAAVSFSDSTDASQTILTKAVGSIDNGVIQGNAQKFKVYSNSNRATWVNKVSYYTSFNRRRYFSDSVSFSVINAVCPIVTKALADKPIPGGSLSVNVQTFDAAALSNAVNGCTGMDDVTCGKAVAAAVNFVDPSGLIGLSAISVQPICNGV